MSTSTKWLRDALFEGRVIPAHPLALTAQRQLDERHQRALTRYYLEAGAGGIAVGVHATQFEIHDHQVGLYKPVLELAMEEVTAFGKRTGRKTVTIAGVVGRLDNALREARLARELEYDCALLSFSGLHTSAPDALIRHAQAVAEVIPLFGFYLQPAIGGPILDFRFWTRFSEIDNAVAIKIAPFNRYRTIEVVRAVAAAGRDTEIALYTGNDDNIIFDLLTEFRVEASGRVRSLRIIGGLLGQWAVWTSKAVELLSEIGHVVRNGCPISKDLMAQNFELTDANGALFDHSHNFAGCIAGINEILRRQGLLGTSSCLDPANVLSPGQLEEIDRVCAAYPHLADDDFVNANLDRWLST